MTRRRATSADIVSRSIAVAIPLLGFSLSGRCDTSGQLAHRVCTQTEAQKAEEEGTYVNTWTGLYRSYVQFGHCDDGAISEGYSDAVVKLLTEHWDRLSDVVPLIKAHPKFERFILRHVDELMSRDQAERLRQSATGQCPRDAVTLCRKLVKRLTAP